MGFKVKINGKVVREITDQRVNKVSLQGPGGEVGWTAITPEQGEINLIVQVADPRQVHLEDIERAAVNRNVTAEDEQYVFIQPLPNESNREGDGTEFDGTPQTRMDQSPAESTIEGAPQSENVNDFLVTESVADAAKREGEEGGPDFSGGTFADIEDGVDTGPVEHEGELVEDPMLTDPDNVTEAGDEQVVVPDLGLDVTEGSEG